jgi:surface protein
MTGWNSLYMIGGTTKCDGAWFGGLVNGKPFIGTQCVVGYQVAPQSLLPSTKYAMEWKYDPNTKKYEIIIDGEIVLSGTQDFPVMNGGYITIGGGAHTYANELWGGSIDSLELNWCSDLTDANYYSAVENCLLEAPVDGLCHTFGYSTNSFGLMPDWDTSLVTNMAGYDGSKHVGFATRMAFNGDISKWDTAQVTDMSFMFYQASAFNQKIGNWSTVKVTDMSGMFFKAALFDSEIKNWDIYLVTNLAR